MKKIFQYNNRIIFSLIFIFFAYSSSPIWAEVKEGQMSDGTPYYYTVSDKKDGDGGDDGGGGNNEGEEDKEGEDSGTDDSGGGGGSNSEDEVSEAEKRAAEAEKAADEALENFKALREEYLALELEAKTISKYTKEGRDYVMEEYEAVKAEYLAAAALLQEKSEAMTDAYRALGQLYETYGYAGDPVQISTGNYICDYVDYEAQDYLNKFQVLRKLSYSSYAESFGTRWFCSLDSRIVRCCYESWDDYQEKIQDCLDKIDEMLHCYDEYNEKYSDLPVDDYDTCMTEANGYLNYVNKLKKILESRMATRASILERNKYVSYGRYTSLSSRYGYENLLIYLDENGNEYKFSIDKNGTWKSVGKVTAEKMYIKNRTDGGYIVYLPNGCRKEYSYYGILEKEIDNNNNETVYLSQNGRINKIRLKTGEEINITRNNLGQILLIQGNVSGKNEYVYDGNNLIEVYDNLNGHLRYEYNDNNLLKKIIKSDESYIEISYESSFWFYRNVCSSVKNQDGQEETFDWNPAERTFIHKTLTGGTEIYKYNELGNTIYKEDSYGNITSFVVDKYGLIQSVAKNQQKQTFQYDGKSRPTKIVNSDGGTVALSYNSYDSLTSITDADGFKKQFEYDSNNNLTGIYFMGEKTDAYVYNPSGLVKKSAINGISTEYEYNKFGSVTKKTVHSSELGNYVERWEYDSKNRPVKYIDSTGYETKIIYESNKRTESSKNQSVITKFDSQGRMIETEVNDLITGKTFSKKLEYDSAGNIVRTYFDGILYEENVYDTSRRLLSTIKWGRIVDNNAINKQGIKTEYTYGKNGIRNKEIVTVLTQNKNNSRHSPLKEESIVFRKVTSSKNGNQTEITVSDYLGLEYRYIFDSSGRLLKEIHPDGYSETTLYTKAGRIKSKTDSNFNQYSYSYRTDGSYYIVKTGKTGNSFQEKYNNRNQLVEIRNEAGQIFSYSYTNLGHLLREKGPGYAKNYEYDIFGRCISCEVENSHGDLNFQKKIIYDDKNNLVSVVSNGINAAICKLDSFGRPIEIKNKYGKAFYEYDVFDNIISMQSENGNTVKYEYDVLGNCADINYPDNIKKSVKRNAVGNVLEVTTNGILDFKNEYDYLNHKSTVTERTGAKRTVNWDKTGNISRSDNSKYGNETYGWANNNSQLVIRDWLSNKYEMNYNLEGNLISENDFSGNRIVYDYDLAGRIIGKSYDNKKDYTIEYDDYNNIEKYADSEKNEIIIERNGIGLITRMKNSITDLNYKYDLYGNLIWFEDTKANIQTEYIYNEVGRCVQKKSNNYDITYDYYQNGNIKKITDYVNKLWIEFEYDEGDRESLIKYSNACVLSINYDKEGRIESRLYRNSEKEILYGEFIVRNNKGLISAICDNSGTWKSFSYTEDGKLNSVIYPYDEEMNDFYYKEALQCGVYMKEDVQIMNIFSLDKNTFSDLKKIIKKAGAEYEFPIQTDMRGLREDITYDSKGNISAIQNVYGKIFYEYDAMNRISKKYGENSRENGMTFKWDKKGNLSYIETSEHLLQFDYGMNNRPKAISCESKKSLERKLICFSYDALGRRILKSINNENNYYYAYDGLSSDIVMYTPVLENDVAATNYFTSQLNPQFTQDSSPYRWIDDRNFVANGEIRTNNYSFSNHDAAEESAFTYITYNSIPFIKVYLDETNFQKKEELILNNYHGEVVGLYDNSDNCMRFKYDVWGNVIGDTSHAVYGFSDDYLDLPVPLYNLGYRDYCPVTKTFTSQDPARDGNNWYSYCSCDCVNNYDSDGYKIVPVTGSYLMTNYANTLLGNSKKETLDKYGCYVTTLANVAVELQKYGVKTNSDYDNPLKINDHKELFSTEKKYEGCIFRKPSMDAITGGNNYDYWTSAVSTNAYLAAQLAKADAISNNCIVMAVFDLRTASNGVADNHMVTLNSNFNEEGYLDFADSITGSSIKDYFRLDSGKLSAYNLNNLKEIRIIETGTTVCNK